MCKGEKKKKDRKTFEDEDNEDDPFAWFSCFLALLMGVFMILLDIYKGQECKLRDVDVETYDDPDQKGQIPFWMQAYGILILTGSLFYIWGRAMRTIMKPVGNILTGLCGRLTLFFIWIIAFLLNLLGYFWLYLASLHRTDTNSANLGDPNYCTPYIWYTAKATVNMFWIFSVLSFFFTFAEMYLFVLGPEFKQLKIVEIGIPAKREGENPRYRIFRNQKTS